MSPQRKGTLLAVAAAFWAAAFFLPYQAATDMVPRAQVVLAMLLVAAVVNSCTILGRRRRSGLRVDGLTLRVSLALGALTATGNLSSASAITTLGAGLTAVALQTQVLFVALMGHFFLRERITMRFAIGATIALGGFAIIRLPTASGAVAATAFGWAIAAAASFATMHVITRRVIDRIDPVTVNALRLWISVFGLAVFSNSLGDTLSMGAHPWALACAAAVFGPVLGRVAIMYAVRFISAARSALIGMVSPICAFILGFIAFGTVPSAAAIVGSALILLGVSLSLFERS